ncbi:MAG: DUF167 domain-containing protein [Syntrophomonadaceae bacterium]|nr:DUF167 domain-containing protein [Syntrophomonadaceae bacterium]
MLKINNTPEGVRLNIRVQPRSSQNKICGVTDGAIKIKITAPPVDGEANQAVIKLLAQWLGVPRSNISIPKGETSKNKIVDIIGIDARWLENKINEYL